MSIAAEEGLSKLQAWRLCVTLHLNFQRWLPTFMSPKRISTKKKWFFYRAKSERGARAWAFSYEMTLTAQNAIHIRIDSVEVCQAGHDQQINQANWNLKEKMLQQTFLYVVVFSMWNNFNNLSMCSFGMTEDVLVSFHWMDSRRIPLPFPFWMLNGYKLSSDLWREKNKNCVEKMIWKIKIWDQLTDCVKEKMEISRKIFHSQWHNIRMQILFLPNATIFELKIVQNFIYW